MEKPAPLLECVPNVSEGRRVEVVHRMAAAASGVEGAALLDRSSDPDHHRSVFTLAGAPEPLVRALLALSRVAIAEIDLRRHRGVHPRLGAVDVVPFVPLRDTPMAVAVAAARRLAAELATEHDLPVFLYGEAAADPGRRELPVIRRGGFEGLEAKLAEARWRPDYGPAAAHPSAGATVVGAREFLIAFNAELDTDDLAVARRIARRVREAGGGPPALRALGVPLAHRGRVQVSMNLVDFRRTGLAEALAAVERQAAGHGARVVSTEIVGLVPRAALDGVDPRALKLAGFDDDRILESRMAVAGLGSG